MCILTIINGIIISIVNNRDSTDFCFYGSLSFLLLVVQHTPSLFLRRVLSKTNLWVTVTHGVRPRIRDSTGTKASGKLVPLQMQTPTSS